MTNSQQRFLAYSAHELRGEIAIQLALAEATLADPNAGTAALREMGAASVKSCVLLRKDLPTARAVRVDYVGFEIPDTFVVGYGLDYNDYYRNLPDIVTLEEPVKTP